MQILDGGTGRELERRGAPFRQPEWSALALIEAPEHVRGAHDAFIAGGADIITTNSYALVPFHIGEERFARDGARLAGLAGSLARQAADAAPREITVAASLPPLFGSYRPDLFDAARAPAVLDVLIRALDPFAGIWLAETQSSLAEVRAVRAALDDDRRPLWLSFTLADEADDAVTHPRLRSGESVAAAALCARDLGAAALLFNCSQPEVMEPAIAEARHHFAGELGVYANAFAPEPRTTAANEGLSDMRADLAPPAYLEWAKRWKVAGATIIGGCCGIGPEHIRELSEKLR